ncbi:MAG: hypothetical protein GJ677_05795 [Rhodobacteraceae bacterium]|nr:hypothetical protein [Paracoccaceae bacterium]
MAHSVETSVPCCLPSFYRHALSANDDDLIVSGRRKVPINQAGSKVLPASIKNRPKQPFCAIRFHGTVCSPCKQKRRADRPLSTISNAISATTIPEKGKAPAGAKSDLNI